LVGLGVYWEFLFFFGVLWGFGFGRAVWWGCGWLGLVLFGRLAVYSLREAPGASCGALGVVGFSVVWVCFIAFCVQFVGCCGVFLDGFELGFLWSVWLFRWPGRRGGHWALLYSGGLLCGLLVRGVFVGCFWLGVFSGLFFFWPVLVWGVGGPSIFFGGGVF